VAVDSGEGVDQIASAAEHADVVIGVLVDVNVGMPRCGVQPGEPTVTLARRVADASGLTLQGVMGYEGQTVGIPDREKRETMTLGAMKRLTASVQAIRCRASCSSLAGGTGTFDISGRIAGITGSGRLLRPDGRPTAARHPSAGVLVLGTVSAVPRRDFATV
jgi:D-serine deaminase-like pyridoxal phosphate-dependent protein